MGQNAIAIFDVQMPGDVRFAGGSAEACIPCKGGASRRFTLFEKPPHHAKFLLTFLSCSTAAIAVLGCAKNVRWAFDFS